MGYALVALSAAAALLAAAARAGIGLAALRAYVRCCEIAVAAQVVLGLALVTGGRRPPVLHWMYGALVLVSLPLGARLGARASPPVERWLLAAGGVASFLFAIRAVTTGM